VQDAAGLQAVDAATGAIIHLNRAEGCYILKSEKINSNIMVK
jgi:hypothetical protein